MSYNYSICFLLNYFVSVILISITRSLEMQPAGSGVLKANYLFSCVWQMLTLLLQKQIMVQTFLSFVSQFKIKDSDFILDLATKYIIYIQYFVFSLSKGLAFSLLFESESAALHSSYSKMLNNEQLCRKRVFRAKKIVEFTFM